MTKQLTEGVLQHTSVLDVYFFYGVFGTVKNFQTQES